MTKHQHRLRKNRKLSSNYLITITNKKTNHSETFIPYEGGIPSEGIDWFVDCLINHHPEVMDTPYEDEEVYGCIHNRQRTKCAEIKARLKNEEIEFPFKRVLSWEKFAQSCKSKNYPYKSHFKSEENL